MRTGVAARRPWSTSPTSPSRSTRPWSTSTRPRAAARDHSRDERSSPPWESDRSDSSPRRGTGSGVIIEADGHILTNHHVIERAERILVKLADGRTLRAEVVGSDPDTDIALIKVSSPQAFPVAPLGDSDGLRVGEWVCAIGNPLAYEHTVTVGVVSYIGRKLFDSSLDNYIQTDAAINFGNSGGPLINARGEVIGINAAISSRASNIGFAVPVNQARAVLPQLKARGRVARGYIGVALKDVDPDLQRSLGLGSTRGALVQDVTEDSPGERAGLRPYDLITAVDGQPVTSNDELIRRIAATEPGTAVNVDLVRDARPMRLVVKLAERPGRAAEPGESRSRRPAIGPPHQRGIAPGACRARSRSRRHRAPAAAGRRARRAHRPRRSDRARRLTPISSADR